MPYGKLVKHWNLPLDICSFSTYQMLYTITSGMHKNSQAYSHASNNFDVVLLWSLPDPTTKEKLHSAGQDWFTKTRT